MSESLEPPVEWLKLQAEQQQAIHIFHLSEADRTTTVEQMQNAEREVDKYRNLVDEYIFA